MDSPEAVAAKLESDVESGKFDASGLDGGSPPQTTSPAEVVPPPIPDGLFEAAEEQPQQAAPLPPQFDPFEWDGKTYDPTQFKTPDDWRAFTGALRNGALKDADYRRKTAEVAENRRQIEAAQAQYKRFFETMANPQYGVALFAEMAREWGLNIPPQMLQQITYDPMAPMRNEIQAIRQEIQQREQQQQLDHQMRAIQDEWEDVKKGNPLIHESDMEYWIALQTGSANLDAQAATQRIAQYKRDYYSWDRVSKLPPDLRDPIFQSWQKDYLTRKQQQVNRRPLSGPGGTAAPTVGKPRLAPMKDWEKRQRQIEDELEGRSA
ncbi:MAG: hypothetical protein AABY75_05465 [Bacteroidota bacterium]